MKTIASTIPLSALTKALVSIFAIASLVACGGDDDNSVEPPAAKALACDDSMKTAFKPDDLTTVLLVKSFKKGDALLLSGTASASTPTAANDLCFVKLNVGPGNAGPVGAPSTSAGIGLEIWLPTKENWNRRIHVKGGGGWAGGSQGTLTALTAGGSGLDSVAAAAGVEGAVSATTDTGHAVGNGSFALNPDGTINEVLWRDFAERGIHEMALKSKALARAYYGEPHKYAYFNGFSTGGRQGMKAAQAQPDDFDGILAGAPAFNWTRFITAELYPQIVKQIDLGGVALTSAQHAAVGAAAVAACGTVGGVNLGYVLDPSSCQYDPATDTSVLCTDSGGVNATAGCVSTKQAQAFNKLWYGQTPDGSVPSPSADNGAGTTLSANQKWYGLTRGTSLAALAGTTPFTISSDLVALELLNPRIADPSFQNATGNGANGWMNLSYQNLASAADQGLALQPQFANINTDNPDLTRFRDRGGKLLSYHGLADVLIPPQGTVHYYGRVASAMGGIPAVQSFYRLFLIPGMTHGFGSGSAVPAAVPLPSNTQLYQLLTDWVEKGVAPASRLDVSSTASASFPTVVSRPICLYPLKPTYTNGNAGGASSYTCS